LTARDADRSGAKTQQKDIKVKKINVAEKGLCLTKKTFKTAFQNRDTGTQRRAAQPCLTASFLGLILQATSLSNIGF